MVTAVLLQLYYGTAKPCCSFGCETFIISIWNTEMKIIPCCTTVFPLPLLEVTLQD